MHILLFLTSSCWKGTLEHHGAWDSAFYVQYVSFTDLAVAARKRVFQFVRVSGEPQSTLPHLHQSTGTITVPRDASCGAEELSARIGLGITHFCLITLTFACTLCVDVLTLVSEGCFSRTSHCSGSFNGNCGVIARGMHLDSFNKSCGCPHLNIGSQ
jgi:hypothetical protein